MRRHQPFRKADDILHDFDPESRTLRITFVGPEGRLLGVTYKLCPLCGVTMEEELTDERQLWACAICGMITTQG